MRILISLWRSVLTWERTSQLALGIALVLFVLDLIILANVPDLQTPALIGVVGLALAIQAIFMWGNRHMVTPYTQAQRHFIAGEFHQVIAVLTDYLENEAHPTLDALVLLGNAYRNLGQLAESKRILKQALARRPNYHFTLYALAKVALAQGDYADAMLGFEQALAQGAPDVIRFDLAHARYRAGDVVDTIPLWRVFTSAEEPHRALLAQYILCRIASETPPAPDLRDAGLPFWIAEAERFAHTPYGQVVAKDVHQLQAGLTT
ncbi:MAG: tetratricopeptide repeat protein [Anaerolineae bacterium]